jgi:hypothetical protein
MREARRNVHALSCEGEDDDGAMSKLDELLPWNWDNPKLDAVAA